ncbi:MAG TPA: glycine--tRNA ligase subunit beta [Pseudomonadales bacterium]|mgnify:FL=1|jgi:glycyl-tRNA synthetase beta chain|nr:glycine--tRNA ligase subunit beta [Pseudomonadales bacterium]MDP6315065.1 glycine--tRNA ligase subunit beta [Pseudomonadales bacterium]MDP7315923.1 glycine--tRNA ligase subunit beta [Pseudomonadales bacterium]HJP52501.1 glycine--tRNA ligase subunit beta [Pseudomonadales bacterium]|tara:strand:- start:7691 stop:9751 length:2061 start_codon:yes stop_codon:yes gene_type:complete
MNSNTKDLLIEIGTEELPPKSLRTMMENLGSNFSQKLNEAELEFESLQTFATPRRLALLIKSLAAAQPDHIVEKRGPSLKAAYDEAGQPSKAALGFMRSCGIKDLSHLEQQETEKGTWLVYRVQKSGAHLKDLITELINSSLAELPIDRRMRWGASREEFVRPVHWLVVLHGSEVLPATVLGVNAGNITSGHRFMAPGEISLDSASSYVNCLHEANVVVDFESRKQLIVDQLDDMAVHEKAEVVVDPDLLDEVTSLVEWPVALLGNFDPEFLKLPEEALISAMQSHQCYFHLVDKDNRLLPKFITIANIASSNPQTVIAGNERVISPRLSDAAFFINQDKKTSLDNRLAHLKTVLFQSKLGSYHDKAERVARLAGYIADKIGADATVASRAGLLCKADLASDMVGEFPELQGIMGGYYARHDGEDSSVSDAISEHYRPVVSGGDLPDTPAGQCVAIADKIDTLTGLFGIDQPPSGSRDPFALRRQTLGIIRICVEKSLALDLRELINEAINIHDQEFDGDAVISYLIERLGVWYQDQGISFDTFSAVQQSSEKISDLCANDIRVRSLQAFRTHARAANLIAANKRIANILKKVDESTLAPVTEAIFTEDAELALFSALGKATSDLSNTENYEEKFLALADLQPAIDRYFDDVMVMADEESLRDNRLATLSQMRNLFLSVADLSVLQ